MPGSWMRCKDFEAADTDHDGLLTAEEIEIYMRSGT